MKTRVIPADAPDAIDSAVETLRAGGLVAFPTDTVYGLGALASDESAVRSIYEAKGRSGEKAIPILVASIEDLEKVAEALPDTARRLAERFWPGPLTLVVPKRASLPQAVSSTGTVGVRIPDHPVALSLLKAAGPLAVTSANRSGEASPCTAQDALLQLDSRIGMILDGGTTPGGIASTVLDCTRPVPVILRVGPISQEEINLSLH